MKKKRLNTRVLIQAAFLAAISIVLTRTLPMITQTLRLGLGEIPLMMSGFMFGPVVGAMTGFAADMIGIAINPQGPPHLGFTFSSMLWGIIPGLYLYFFSKYRKGQYPFKMLNVGLVIAFSIILVSLILNTYWLSHIYGKGFIALLPQRLTAAVINIPVQTIIVTNLLKQLDKFIER